MPKQEYTKYSTYDASTPLSSVYKKRAAKELGEESDQISAHLESFRRWIDSMPHLKCTKGILSLFDNTTNYLHQSTLYNNTFCV